MTRRLLAPLAALAILASPVFAQDAGVRVTGVLLDATMGVRLPGAVISLVGENRSTAADREGVFVLEGVSPGRHVLALEQYGYSTGTVPIDVAQGMEPLVFELEPNPLLVDGITAVIDRVEMMRERLESRRRATPVSVRAMEQNRLLTTGAANVSEFLTFEAHLQVVPCGRASFSTSCVVRRGQLVEPFVYIDEMPMIGGIDVLASYRPYELYLVEVYGSGREIRAYTHQFMERMARRPIALLPALLR